MSEVLAQLEKKGGAMSETVLWTNPSPSSSFASQDITLSSSMADFDYIKVVFRISTTDSSEYIALAEKKLIINSSSGANHPKLSIGTSDSQNSFTNVRFFLKKTDTSFNVANARNSSTGANTNSYLIPVQIIGLK